MIINQEIVDVKIKRNQLCDLIIACAAIASEDPDNAKKWRDLHEQLKEIRIDFDKKYFPDL